MPKDGYITARVDKRAKLKAEKVLRRVGVSTTDAINMLLHQIVLHDGIPFQVRVPNAETRKAIEELENPAKRAKLKTFATTEEMFADIDADTRTLPKKRA